VGSLPAIPEDSALARLFTHPRVQEDATWFSLPGGQTLFRAGDTSDELYVLRVGRLGAIRREPGHEIQFLGVIRPGEPAGEMSLIAGAPHSADVVSLRDSEIIAVPKETFFEACEAEPDVMIELAKLMMLRSRQAVSKTGVGEPSVFGFLPLGACGQLRPLVERIGYEIAQLGYSVTTIGAEAQTAPTEWFSDVEKTHDFVLYVGETADSGWLPVVARQVDRLFRVGRGDRKPPRAAEPAATPLEAQGLVDLILLQSPDAERPMGSTAWMDAAQPTRLFHVRRDNAADEARIARILTGQSVGLVLSGGGARAYAHIGAIRALREHGVPIDFVGGVSMGAIIAAGLAMGWNDEEMERRIREAFVDTSPLDDIAVPILAMTHGLKVNERLAHHFKDTQICDLWLPFFCLSSNLTTGAYHMHRKGLLRAALRASISLPGILPPATDDNNVLVDGAVMKNFPADVMRASQLGPIVGVDVTHGRSITADDVARPASVWRWLWSGEWRRGPPIVSLLMRAATVTTSRDLAAAHEATDLLITPEVADVEIRDFSAYDPAVAEGYRATNEALVRLKHPVQELRRRPSLAEKEAAKVLAPAAQ
jgi:NTE family protein